MQKMMQEYIIIFNDLYPKDNNIGISDEKLENIRIEIINLFYSN